MAVSAHSALHNMPEFRRPASFRPRPADGALGSSLPAARSTVPARGQRVRARQASWSGRALRSRLLDDLCAIVVGACGIFFTLAVARMLLSA